MIRYKSKGLNRATSIGGAVLQGATAPKKRSFFGRLWRGAVKLAIGIIPGDFAEEILEAFNVDLNRVEVYDIDDSGNLLLSDVENAAIENWLVNSFAPKYKAMLEKGNQLFATTDANLQISLINQLNNELAVLKEYLKWDNPKLSPGAEEKRNEVVTELIEEIEHLIYKTIDAAETEYIAENVTVESSTPLLFPIISYIRFQATATNYRLGNVVLPTDLTPIDTTNPISSDNTEKSKSNGLLTLGAIAFGGIILGKLVSK